MSVDGGDDDRPSRRIVDSRQLLLAYLDLYRDSVAAKVDGLSGGALATALVPSGWTPLELVNHLAAMERRWLQWGFVGEPLDDPWADHDPATGRWTVADGEGPDQALSRLRATGARTRTIVEGAGLDQPARTGGRFPPGTTPPDLQWILLHVVTEYARHLGHLDIVRELLDGEVGE